MDESMIINIGGEAIRVIIYIAGPMLICAMIVGIVISILQAITQINEATLTFIPKMVAVVVVLIVAAPWMLKILQEYTINVISNAGMWVK